MSDLPAKTLRTLRLAVRRRLLPWFAKNARELPWRMEPRNPYEVWISEIMLQQTRVETVIPYFRRFLARFPNAAALAAASPQDVLKLWEGLGYYSRARQIHKAAQILVRDHAGKLPNAPAQLAVLPGLGPYTTAAIASLAFGHPLAVLDGNVIRVLARLLALRDDAGRPATRRKLQRLADILLYQERAAATNEAWMELGALVCTPRNPRCTECPLHNICRAAKLKNPEAFPRKKKKMKVPHKVVGAAVILNARNRILIAQRNPEGGMLAGLWEFPGGKQAPGETMKACIARELKEEMGIEIEVGPHLVTVHHAYTHFTIELHAHFARIQSGRPRHLDCAGHAWVTADEFDHYPFSKADHGIIHALRALPKPPRHHDCFK
ncbi:MAG: A/G-specific adenine glycosylase [Kiritimatiellae bacterium]|jgi:A/G-specific adenine glycosylase|nr:A/G-specific adenine glycosylase [Kiritimatiellia bacterium]NLD90391.1 A/G-specific adenine glycosylase [Lentisphaerota bacterium]HPC19453.1 A/G-specific adenine glycosylase [Kiritimatiellia bacterium]HQN80284.1 A/G-specific adenine glycosylase [Kiritimatiellia bacterium]